MNDVSHIAPVRELTNGETAVKPVLQDARLFHEYALTLACAYAIAHDINAVLWQKDQTTAGRDHFRLPQSVACNSL